MLLNIFFECLRVCVGIEDVNLRGPSTSPTSKIALFCPRHSENLSAAVCNKLIVPAGGDPWDPIPIPIPILLATPDWTRFFLKLIPLMVDPGSGLDEDVDVDVDVDVDEDEDVDVCRPD